jgi:hypothetical protein
MRLSTAPQPIHSSSTGFAHPAAVRLRLTPSRAATTLRSLIRKPFRRACATAILAAVAVSSVSAVPSSAAPQVIDALLYRIFLRDGSTLVSYGDFARVADRVVFSIPIGGLDTPSPLLHLVSVAESAVDWDRTDRYTQAMRARHYAATRGEADFNLLSEQVARALNDVALTKNPEKRLALATEARRTLGSWPAAHYGYRAADVKQLATLLDDAIGELRVNAGLSRFDLSLVAIADASPIDEPELPAPSQHESLDQAYAAAALTPDSSERVSLLEAVMYSLRQPANGSLRTSPLHAKASAALAAENRIDQEYRSLVSRTILAADERARRARMTSSVGGGRKRPRPSSRRWTDVWTGRAVCALRGTRGWCGRKGSASTSARFGPRSIDSAARVRASSRSGSSPGPRRRPCSRWRFACRKWCARSGPPSRRRKPRRYTGC